MTVPGLQVSGETRCDLIISGSHHHQSTLGVGIMNRLNNGDRNVPLFPAPADLLALRVRGSLRVGRRSAYEWSTTD